MNFSELEQLIFVILVGAAVGSFLNVVIYRLPRGKSIVSPGSRCGVCKSPIAAGFNIPLLTYLYTKGRCQSCGSIYSFRYFLLELLTPLLFLAIWYHFGWNSQALLVAVFAACLLVASFIDLDLRIIPDSLTLGAWGVATFLAFVAPESFPITWTESLVGGAIGFFSYFLLSRGFAVVMGYEGLGGGDVKFMGFIGAFTGWSGVLTTTFLASMSGAFVGILLMIALGKGRRYPIPFGPFLAAGALMHILGLDLVQYLGLFSEWTVGVR